jgi:hypothetical protein
MKHIIFIILIFSASSIFAQYPQSRISNGVIEANLYLPDAKKGFYRGTRFDWSGIINSLKYNDHEYFGKWYQQHDPAKHDAITGPVEAFDPIDYTTAAPGEKFLKIGIGILKKVKNEPYGFSKPFEVLNAGKWKVRTKSDRVEFIHTLSDDSGYSYIYKKTVRLAEGKSQMILEHSLKNTGQKAISTSVFNHNFFVIDNQTTGPDFSVSMPFKISSEPAKKSLMTFIDNKMVYTRDLKKGESTMEYPKGFTGTSIGDYDFRIENQKTGAAVRITSDRPLSHLMYWSVPTTLSPEPFIKIDALPGEEFTWSIIYDFYTIDKR